MGRKPQIEFVAVDISEVPTEEPISNHPVVQAGSQWDDAIKALTTGEALVIRVKAQSEKSIQTLKSTLKVRATNLQIGLEVREGKDCFYAWLTERFGRFPKPEISN